MAEERGMGWLPLGIIGGAIAFWLWKTRVAEAEEIPEEEMETTKVEIAPEGEVETLTSTDKEWIITQLDELKKVGYTTSGEETLHIIISVPENIAPVWRVKVNKDQKTVEITQHSIRARVEGYETSAGFLSRITELEDQGYRRIGKRAIPTIEMAAKRALAVRAASPREINGGTIVIFERTKRFLALPRYYHPRASILNIRRWRGARPEIPEEVLKRIPRLYVAKPLPIWGGILALKHKKTVL